MTDSIEALRRLRHRINLKEPDLGMFDLDVIEEAIKEIWQLRINEAKLQEELQRKKLEILSKEKK